MTEGTGYRYEIRRGDEIIATGRLTSDHRFDVGDEMTIGRHRGLVRAVEPLLSSREYRLVLHVPAGTRMTTSDQDP